MFGKAAPKVTGNTSFQRLRNHVYTYGGFTGSDEDRQTLQREHPKLQLTETSQRMRVAAGFTESGMFILPILSLVGMRRGRFQRQQGRRNPRTGIDTLGLVS